MNKLDGKVGKNTRKEGFGPGGDRTILPICWSTHHLFLAQMKKEHQKFGVHNIGGTFAFKSKYVYYMFELLIT